MDEESLTSFMAITGADGATAQQYLEVTNWNMEEAVNLFMETGGSGTSFPSSGGNAGAAAANNSSTFDPYGGQQNVRAPDPSKRQRLVGGDADVPFPAQFFGRNSSNRFANMPNNPNGLFQRNFAEESIASLNAHLGRQDSDRRDPQSLSQLFQPPVGLIFHGSLSEARSFAKQESKWLLVNIQDETVFASLRLNRDTWSDDLVQNLVSSSFVFWQSNVKSDQGKKFCALYQIDPDVVPVTCIIDPRTGQKLVQWHDFIEKQEMAEKLSDFCCLNPLGAPTAPPPAPAPRERTEDEELAAAIAASLERDDDDDGYVEEMEDDDDEEIAEEKPEVFVPLPDEPADGPTVTRVQIRTTAGTRLVRRFYKGDSVSVLWQLVRQEIPEARSRPFELRTSFPPAAVPLTDQTLSDAKLENASLMMQWKPTKTCTNDFV
ncbi:hypothetical protein Ae201684P_012054 [Aphanomyces euteiches]|nr:hypothetical protein Ae201684P_012054 [Aphanomyces euteiches]